MGKYVGRYGYKGVSTYCHHLLMYGIHAVNVPNSNSIIIYNNNREELVRVAGRVYANAKESLMDVIKFETLESLRREAEKLGMYSSYVHIISHNNKTYFIKLDPKDIPKVFPAPVKFGYPLRFGRTKEFENIITNPLVDVKVVELKELELVKA
jgi:hypothetical protein